MIQLVFAHSNLSFGSNGELPWDHISQDFKNFKKRTSETVLIMGANTFASLPSKLPGRIHYVLIDQDRCAPVAKDGSVADVHICKDNLLNILEHHRYSNEIISVIGGPGLLKLAEPFARRVYMTSIAQGKALKPVDTYIDPELINTIKQYNLIETLDYSGDGWSISEQTFIKQMQYLK